MDGLVIEVTGMTCVGCEMHVKGALEGVEGVENASVSFAEGRAVVRGSGGEGWLDRLVVAIKSAGYGARTSEKAAPAPIKSGAGS